MIIRSNRFVLIDFHLFAGATSSSVALKLLICSRMLANDGRRFQQSRHLRPLDVRPRTISASPLLMIS